MSERALPGRDRHTRVACLDEPGAGGACHQYAVQDVTDTDSDGRGRVLGFVSFQDGPIGEVGVNGVHNEDLLAIVVDRLQHFQAGEFRCRENAIALTKIEEALLWLGSRTKRRSDAGVEGTHEKMEGEG